MNMCKIGFMLMPYRITRDEKTTYPVKNRFPMLALAKLKTELGRALFTISMFV